jgi:hypothetical protein
MTVILKADTAVVVQFGPFLDAGDGVSLEEGLITALDNATTGIRITKNGGTLAAREATVTTSIYDAMGLYQIALKAGDVDTEGSLRMIFEESATCLPVWQDFMIVQANVYDSLYAVAGTNLDVALLTATQTSIDTIETNIDDLNKGAIYGVTTANEGLTSTETDLSGYISEELVGRLFVITSGAGDGQARTILTYTSTNGVVTFAALTTAPSGSPFKIV